MNLLSQYKYHLQNKKKASKTTIKNYLSDIKKFIDWFENTNQSTFNPKKLTIDTIELYKLSLIKNKTSQISLQRYLSSLRSFSIYLKLNSLISENPFDNEIKIDKNKNDPALINQFRLHLKDSNLSKNSIKNYLIDIKHFTKWLNEISANENTDSNEMLLSNINPFTANEYKNRLQMQANFSPSSINRKLSSIRKYLSWIETKKIIKKNTPIDKTNNKKSNSINSNISFSSSIQHDNNRKISENKDKTILYKEPILNVVAPNLRQNIFDKLLTLPLLNLYDNIKYLIWKLNGKKIFLKESISTYPVNSKTPLTETILKPSKDNKKHQIKNFQKAFYAPLSISTNNWPKHKIILHHLKYTRPKWYRIYHSYPLSSHIHIGILIMATSIFGYMIYNGIYGNLNTQKAVFASSSIPPPKTLAFKGKLTDKKNNPISAETPLRFAIYNNEFSSGSALLWQENLSIIPDQQGKFTAILGLQNTITPQIFSDNDTLYLGMTIGNENELQPRQLLPNTANAENAIKLQGLKPITQNAAGTKNVILALDSLGNLNIGGKAAPVFQATGGKFTLSGKTLLLTTGLGTDTNIELNPDGTGIIDLQKPIQNTSNNNNIPSASGAVEINDLLAILATSSGQSAFTINQNSTGPLISASTSGVAKFTLGNDGTGTFAGNLNINGNDLTSANTTFNLLNKNTLNLNLANSATSISIGSNTGSTSINNMLTANKGLTIPSDQSLILSGNIASNLLPSETGTFNLGSETLHWKNAYIDNLFTTTTANVSIGLNTANPTAKLEVNGKAKIKAGLIVDNNGTGNIISASSSGTSRFVITETGNVGINDTNPSNTLKVTGSICAGNSNGSCAGNTPGTIYAINTALQNADVAENYISSENLEPGDIIMPEGKNKNEAIIKTTKRYQKEAIGIISTKPGITLNSEAINDETHPNKYPVALSGRVPVKISTENGNIQAGDNITTSSIPGVGMKATGKGIIIARALESYQNINPNEIGMISVFVNLSYYEDTTGRIEEYNTEYNKNPQSNLLNKLNTGFIQAKKSITDSLVITTENITIGSQTLSQYINASVEKILQKQMENKIITTQPISPLASPSSQIKPFTLEPSPFTPSTNHQATQSAAAPTSPLLANPSTIQSSTSASPISSMSATENNSLASNSALLNDIPISTENTLDLITKGSEITKTFADIASFSAMTNLNTNEQLSNLMVLGQTTLSDAAIAGNLNIGGSLILANNSINTIGNPLQLQPLRQGDLSIMGGLVAIDTNGNLRVNGNATFAKNLTIKGKLTTNFIAPIPNSDLIIQLNNQPNPTDPDSIIHNSQFVIRNSSQSAVLAINQKGDLSASGAGTFRHIAAGAFNIIRGAQADTSLTETVASSSAGTAIIIANEKERTIISPYVTEDSLIYLTATSDSEGIIPYIARQTPHNPLEETKGSFTIAIPYPITKDLKLNWWIIN